MITSKITKTPNGTTEERLFKLLESIDWKLWEIMNMMKDNLPEKLKAAKTPKTTTKKEATPE
jgi:hypothetical protein